MTALFIALLAPSQGPNWNLRNLSLERHNPAPNLWDLGWRCGIRTEFRAGPRCESLLRGRRGGGGHAMCGRGAACETPREAVQSGVAGRLRTPSTFFP